MDYVTMTKTEMVNTLRFFGYKLNDFMYGDASRAVSKTTLNRAIKNGKMTAKSYDRLVTFLKENNRDTYIPYERRNNG